KNLSRYYQGMNLISTSNFMYRIKSNATLLATIAILCATTLTAFGMSYGIYYNINAEMSLNHPFSYEYRVENPHLNTQIDNVIAKYPHNKILKSVDINYLVIDGSSVNSNNDPIGLYIVSESTYARIARAKDLKQIALHSPDETLLFGTDIPWLTKNTGIKLSNINTIYTIADRNDYRLSNSMYITMVVQDEVYNQLSTLDQPDTIRALLVDNQKDSAALTADLGKIIDINNYQAFYPQYMVYMEQRGVLMFVGAFLGLVLLFATGSIIYFRQLNEAEKEKGNYRILRNIGVNRKEVRNSVSKQIFYVFLFPLIVGIAHCSAALAVLSQMIYYQSRFGLLISTIVTIIVFMVIYLLYYFLTVNSYNKIVNSDS
ncbi:MAG: FtsX-like permease family protein, partial [Syntrophomonas sp.]